MKLVSLSLASFSDKIAEPSSSSSSAGLTAERRSIERDIEEVRIDSPLDLAVVPCLVRILSQKRGPARRSKVRSNSEMSVRSCSVE